MDEYRRISVRRPSGSLPLDDVDEAAAGMARRLYQLERMVPLRPDPAIASLLAPGEVVLAIRPCVGFERRPASDAGACAGRGDLYLTSARLILLGQRALVIGLGEIQEAMLSGDRLLLVLCDGAGLSLEVERPLLLRVEIATARAAARSQGGGPGAAPSQLDSR